MILLQFVSDPGVTARVIEWWGSGSFSHVDSILPDGGLLGARIGGGVKIRQPNYMKFTRILQVRLDTDAVMTQDYYAWLNAQIGKSYDITAILGFAAGRDWREDDSWMCSEMVASGLELCTFFPYKLSTPSNRIDPSDLLMLISARINMMTNSLVIK